ncbi:leucyl aminopeptidase family protein [Limibaculum sp. FT325]|uniref:leucyl aminopeptidase family protein n=1 Tax=Thermohalobaculum sediminis TaxID=2939436 RepID=UPI0020BF4CBD|nr:leucyl aminopeptidase family protein [Limibaculum sediminis]MCL5776031.1 leucyl aminopeptidase family protein [Limibaculum sediminis]
MSERAGDGAAGADAAEAAARAPVPIDLVDADRLDEHLATLPAADAAWARANGFRAALGTTLALPGADGAIARVLFGWGTAVERRRTRFALGRFAETAPAGVYRLATRLDPAEAEEAALGWLLARYRFERYRSAPERGEAHLAVPEGVDGARLGKIAEGVFLARDLINTPANEMGPAALEAAARKLAERHGARVDVTTGDALLDANFPLIHAVGRASAEAPRLIDMTWGAADGPLVTLVGKGVCFDTGGLDLKPSSSMALMKKDMGGAATVLGLAHMVMSLGLRLRLRVLIPAVENAVSGASFRPGDILRSRKGLTVEINNTDAEGRLVLADALTLASEEAPGLIVDMATLTGAARVALGPEVVPFYTDDDGLAADLAQAAARVSDPLWRMPLWPGYEADIEPGIADLDNAPSGGMAGSITAALFLRRFVDQTAWAHFDIYAWTPKPKPGRPKGAEAQAARALLAVLERRYGRP